MPQPTKAELLAEIATLKDLQAQLTSAQAALKDFASEAAYAGAIARRERGQAARLARREVVVWNNARRRLAEALRPTTNQETTP